MDTLSYRTEYWKGREVMPADSMRFTINREIPKAVRAFAPKLGQALPVERDYLGRIIAKPRRYSAGQEDYTIGAYVTDGDKSALGKLLDKGARLGRKRRKR